MVECWNKVFHEFSTEIVQELSAIHLAFQTKCKMVSNRTLEVRIPRYNIDCYKLGCDALLEEIFRESNVLTYMADIKC